MVAVPIGLGSAIYLSEYATPRVRKLVKPMLEVLVGVPTIVFGYFALTFITPTLLQDILSPQRPGLQRALGGAGDGLHDRADDRLDLRGLDDAPCRRACARGPTGSGATKRQVATRVVFPAAISGIVASIVLGDLARRRRDDDRPDRRRAAAELEPQPARRARHVTTFMGATAKGDNPAGTIGYESIFACGLTLFVLTLLMNMVAIRFVRKYREVYE